MWASPCRRGVEQTTQTWLIDSKFVTLRFQLQFLELDMAVYAFAEKKMLMGQWYQALSTNQRINCGVSTRMFCCFVPAKLPFFEDTLVTKHGLLKAPKYRWISQWNVQIFSLKANLKNSPTLGRCLSLAVSQGSCPTKNWRTRLGAGASWTANGRSWKAAELRGSAMVRGGLQVFF